MTGADDETFQHLLNLSLPHSSNERNICRDVCSRLTFSEFNDMTWSKTLGGGRPRDSSNPCSVPTRFLMLHSTSSASFDPLVVVSFDSITITRKTIPPPIDRFCFNHFVLLALLNWTYFHVCLLLRQLLTSHHNGT